MKIAGIVAEYNPFHTGHAHHIQATREYLGGDTAIVCVMSGNWVQRGEGAVSDKWTRAALALRGGADLVLELPTVWAASSAEQFAMGAVAMLGFGVWMPFLRQREGCLEELNTAADCLLSEEYRLALTQMLGTGGSFAALRQSAVRSCIGEGAACLSFPNNNLGVEYLKALKRLDSNMTPVTVPRRGAGHDTDKETEGFLSASALRRLILNGQWAQAGRYLPEGGAQLLREGGLACLTWCERGVLARLKTMSADDFARLPDSGEGLGSRLADAVRRGCSLEEIYTLTKTKRYAHSRVRRLVLWAFLGLTGADRPEHPPYLRVLGMNGRGRSVLRRMSKACPLPIITKPAHAKKLSGAALNLFVSETRCTDLYNLCRSDLSDASCGMEYVKSPVVL